MTHTFTVPPHQLLTSASLQNLEHACVHLNSTFLTKAHNKSMFKQPFTPYMNYLQLTLDLTGRATLRRRLRRNGVCDGACRAAFTPASAAALRPVPTQLQHLPGASHLCTTGDGGPAGPPATTPSDSRASLRPKARGGRAGQQHSLSLTPPAPPGEKGVPPGEALLGGCRGEGPLLTPTPAPRQPHPTSPSSLPSSVAISGLPHKLNPVFQIGRRNVFAMLKSFPELNREA